MKIRVFLDTNVFIYAYEFPESNSAQVIELLNRGEIEAIISERVLKEVQAYFKKFYHKDIAAAFRYYLLRTCIVVLSAHIKKEIGMYKNSIKDKDLEQLAAVKKFGIKFLVAYDRDFENFEEYITPKNFIKQFNLKPALSNY